MITEVFNQIFVYVFIALFAFLITNFATPMALVIGEKFKILDIPNHRKIHKKSIIRSGGIAILIGFYFSISLLIFFSFFTDIFYGQINIKYLILILSTTSIFFTIGLVDDIFNKTSAIFRLFLEIIISIIVWSNGIKIEFINFSLDSNTEIILPKILSLLITVLWITGITNAINWLDGMNGLLSIFIINSALGFFIISFFSENYIICFITSIVIGISISFFINNVYKLKIFMGDSGSLFLGALISLIGILVGSDIKFISSNVVLHNFNPYIPLLVLMIPIFDMTRVVVKRLINGISPFYSDKNHIHHVLTNYGYKEKQILLIVFTITQLTSTVAIFLSTQNTWTAITSFFLFYLIFVILFYVPNQK